MKFDGEKRMLHTNKYDELHKKGSVQGIRNKRGEEGKVINFPFREI